MRTACKYNGLKAYRLENEQIEVVIIPELGGKIASLKRKSNQIELLFQPKNPYTKPSVFNDFSLFQPSGIDDCFPSINEEEIEINGERFHYPDHGEIWSSRMSEALENSSDEALNLVYESGLFHYRYEKKIQLEENRLVLSYKITNLGLKDFYCFYTFHGLFRYESDLQIDYPKDTAEILNVLEHKVLGKAGDTHPFPDTVNYDFRKLGLNEEPDMIKYYVNHKTQDGNCALVYPELATKVNLQYDAEKLPYLGVWITRGGFQGDYNLALEPSSGFYDSIGKARPNHKLDCLQPDECFDFELKITLSDVF